MNYSVLKTSLNISLKTVLSGLLALPVLLISNQGNAKNNTWTPENANELVLSYQPSSKIPLNSDLATYSSENWKQLQPKIYSLLSQSSYPGKSQLEQQAQMYMSKWTSIIEKDNHLLTPRDISQLKLFNAQLLQKKHRFKEALQELNSIPTNHKLYAQALLIESRIHHIQGHYEQARQSCSQLISQKLPLFAQLCLLETEALAGRPEQAYKLLKDFEVRYSKSSAPVLNWYHQVAGTIARILNQTSDAEQHFSFNLNQAPNSQWFQWADMALNNGNADLVMKKMAQLESPGFELEDGLIIRLARAEKMLGNNTQYQSLAKQRVNLRVKRNDQLHAADIAYYYIYIAPQTKQALYWAEKNWQSVKEPADRELLTLAQQLNQKGVAHE